MMTPRFLIMNGFASGVVFVYGMVLGFIMLFSGLFNIDSFGGFIIQFACLIYLYFLTQRARDAELRQIRLEYAVIGFCVGSFFGLSFVAAGIWHGVVPPV